MGKKSRMLATGLDEKGRMEQAIVKEKKEREERAKEFAETIAGLIALRAQGTELEDKEKKLLEMWEEKHNGVVPVDIPKKFKISSQNAALSAIDNAFIRAVRMRKVMEEKKNEQDEGRKQITT